MFPTIAGASLAGKRYTLPQDFEGRLNVAVIVFQRDQQAEVDTWGDQLAQLAVQYPDLRYYELPVLPNYGWLQQAFIDGGMRSGIADRTVRARTITLYTDVARFNAALALPTIDSIYVLLVDRQGNVQWRADGVYTVEKAEALTRVLVDLFSDRPAPA